MSSQEFIDYYELLQLHPNADADAVERMFRHLAKKYHPDNAENADINRFRQLVDAHRTLADPESRAGYDVKYQEYWNRKWGIASEATKSSAFIDDLVTRENMLSLLYVQRRRDIRNPGMGDAEMGRLLRLPVEVVDFHLWYLKAKKWVERLESGMLAITAEGVDQVEQSKVGITPNHLLEAQRRAHPETDDDRLLPTT